MKGATVAFLSLLTMYARLPQTGEAADAGCTYDQNLLSNTSYYAYNPRYPEAYRGRHDCEWTARSAYRVRLTCEIDIPWSPNCTNDYLGVKLDGSTTRRHCGKDSFAVVSTGNSITVTASSQFFSMGGKYLCDMRAIEKIQESEDCRCGWKKPTRIVGGVETGINEFPMMAGIVDFVQRTLIGGATIISEVYVLTAAHVVANRKADQLGVLVGDHDLSTGRETNATALYRVRDIVIHQDYRAVASGNDISVIRIEGRFEFSNEVGPACLPFEHNWDSFAGSPVDILGWGTTDFAGEKSTVLRVASVDVVTNLVCRKSYSGATRDQLCTSGTKKDACQFDSGGPVLWQNPTTRRLVHAGIISFGISCAADVPSVNTRVGAFIDWIVLQTPGAFYCMIE